MRAVGEGKIDVGIVSGYERTEALQVTPVPARDRRVLVTPRGHALAAAGVIAFTDTLAFDQIGLNEGSALRAFLQRICDDLHKTLKLRIEVGSFEVACRMVEAGVGVAVMPESAARRHALAIPIEIVALREMHVCVRSLDVLPGFARDLIELLVEDAREG